MRALRRLARYVSFYAVDAFVKTFNRSRTAAPCLLLVRIDAIGDFVIWLDSAKEFRSRYPDKRIVLCVNSTVYELAKLLPHWDEVLEVDVKRFSTSLRYRFEFLLQLRRRSFGTVIQPTFSRVFLHGDSIVRATGAKHRIGSIGDFSNTHPILKSISNAWYTKLVPAAPGPMMELERNAEFIQNFTERAFHAHPPVLPRLAVLSAELKIQPPYFIIFPGASWVGRQWPVANFAQVALKLHQATGWTPLLCGGASDVVVCQSVIDQSGIASAINLGGSTNLAELTELLRSARLLISNETSAVHIAVAVSTPTVCVLGGGHYGRFMPYPIDIAGVNCVVATHKMSCYNCNWHCTQPHKAGGAVPCIANVTVKSVLERVEAVLSRAQNQNAMLRETQTT